MVFGCSMLFNYGATVKVFNRTVGIQYQTVFIKGSFKNCCKIIREYLKRSASIF